MRPGAISRLPSIAFLSLSVWQRCRRDRFADVAKLATQRERKNNTLLDKKDAISFDVARVRKFVKQRTIRARNFARGLNLRRPTE